MNTTETDHVYQIPLTCSVGKEMSVNFCSNIHSLSILLKSTSEAEKGVYITISLTFIEYRIYPI